MSAFTGPLAMTWLDADSRLAWMNDWLTYEVGSLGSGRKIIVPRGTISDGASVPQLLWELCPPWGGQYCRSSVIHDRLCWLLVNGTPHPEAPTYDRAADIFHEAMGVEGTPEVQREAMYLAVKAWSDLPNRFKGTDKNPYPCGSVQDYDVVFKPLAA